MEWFRRHPILGFMAVLVTLPLFGPFLILYLIFRAVLGRSTPKPATTPRPTPARQPLFEDRSAHSTSWSDALSETQRLVVVLITLAFVVGCVLLLVR